MIYNDDDDNDNEKNRTTDINTFQCRFPPIENNILCHRVAEVAREHGWHPPKSLDSDENFKPEHTLFCRELRFVAIYALFFGDLWA